MSILRFIAAQAIALLVVTGCTSQSPSSGSANEIASTTAPSAAAGIGGGPTATNTERPAANGGSVGVPTATSAAGSRSGTAGVEGAQPPAEMMGSAGTGGGAGNSGGNAPGEPLDATRDAGPVGGVGGQAADGGIVSRADQGPKDGDPSKPVVELAEVPCRTEQELSGQSSAMVNVEIDGRGLVIDYPCGKHEGAQMTLILNLHGTLALGAPFTYQRGYFPAYRLASSHNLIVVHPQSASTFSVGAQWGNQDNGTDTPHLDAVMKWVYEKFSKLNIRSTWIAGHSWGAAYAEGAYDSVKPGYVCNELFKDKFKGVIGLSYIATPPCADRVSMIGSQGEDEDYERLDQGQVAAAHGCDPMMKGPELIGTNERRYWDGCDPGWVHEDWHMLGKGHIDALDPEVVQSIIESVKGTEL